MGTKADLIRYIESEERQSQSNAPVAGAKVMDDSTMVQMLNPKTAETFQDYPAAVFILFSNVGSSGHCLGCVHSR